MKDQPQAIEFRGGRTATIPAWSNINGRICRSFIPRSPIRYVHETGTWFNYSTRFTRRTLAGRLLSSSGWSRSTLYPRFNNFMDLIGPWTQACILLERPVPYNHTLLDRGNLFFYLPTASTYSCALWASRGLFRMMDWCFGNIISQAAALAVGTHYRGSHDESSWRCIHHVMTAPTGNCFRTCS